MKCPSSENWWVAGLQSEKSKKKKRPEPNHSQAPGVGGVGLGFWVVWSWGCGGWGWGCVFVVGVGGGWGGFRLCPKAVIFSGKISQPLCCSVGQPGFHMLYEKTQRAEKGLTEGR